MHAVPGRKTVLVKVTAGLQVLSLSYRVHRPGGFLHFSLQMRMRVRVSIRALLQALHVAFSHSCPSNQQRIVLVFACRNALYMVRHTVSMHCGQNHCKQCDNASC